MSNRCPHDHDHALWPLRTPVKSRGCHRCEGMWLPGPVVASVLGTPELAGLGALPVTALSCPDDARTLHAVHHHGVEIDVCPSCHGVWLDRGELASILAATPAAAEETDSALDEVDFEEVMEVLFDRSDAPSHPSGQGPSDGPVETVAPDLFDAGPDGTTRPSSLDGFSLELERPDATVEAVLPTGMEEADGLLDSVSGSIGDAMGSVLEFIGEAFSGL